MEINYEEKHMEKFFTISFIDEDGNISGISGFESDPKIRKYFRDQVIKELRNIFGGNKKIHE